MRAFDYVKPRSLSEAIAFVAERPTQARFYAGGTDLIVRMRDRRIEPYPQFVVDVKDLPGMRDIAANGNGVTIGAAATLNAVAESALVRERCGLLAEAAATVGAYQVRNRATLGGNVCNAAPSADTAPALLCLAATVNIAGPDGGRAVPIGEFFTGPGQTVLQPGEMVTALHVPAAPAGAAWRYHKLGRVRAGDLAVVGVAVLGWPADTPSGRAFRLALGAVAPTPIRVPQAEAILAEAVDEAAIERAAEAAQAAARPISDVRASAAYRQAMVQTLTRRGVTEVLDQLTGRPS